MTTDRSEQSGPEVDDEMLRRITNPLSTMAELIEAQKFVAALLTERASHQQAVEALRERAESAEARLAIALHAVEIADGVMNYCQGDAWEREATAADREQFQEIYITLFPPAPQVADAKAKMDWQKCDQCGGRFRGERGLRDHWRAKHAAIAPQEG